MVQQSSMGLMVVLAAFLALPVPGSGQELNEYQHAAPEGRLTLNKYRAARHVLPDSLLAEHQSRALGGGGINIGNIMGTHVAPRTMNIYIDGDVVNYCLNCNERRSTLMDR